MSQSTQCPGSVVPLFYDSGMNVNAVFFGTLQILAAATLEEDDNLPLPKPTCVREAQSVNAMN